MKKGWKIIGVLVLVVIILGGICLGVGIMTGAEYSRIYDVLNSKYGISSLYQSITQYFNELSEIISSAKL